MLIFLGGGEQSNTSHIKGSQDLVKFSIHLSILSKNLFTVFLDLVNRVRLCKMLLPLSYKSFSMKLSWSLRNST